MDAKPQRPVRVFRIRDENVPLHDTNTNATVSKQHIHQRNRSSPALCSLDTNAIAGSGNVAPAKPGAQQVQPKRTAFSDVSNVQRRHTVKDKSSFSLLQRPDTTISSRPPQKCGNNGNSATQPSSTAANSANAQDYPKNPQKKTTSRGGTQRTSSSIASEKTTELKRKTPMRKRETAEKESTTRESQHVPARHELPTKSGSDTTETEVIGDTGDGNQEAIHTKNNTELGGQQSEISVADTTHGLELNDLAFIPEFESHPTAEYAQDQSPVQDYHEDAARPVLLPEQITYHEGDYIRNGELENLKIEEEPPCHPIEEVLFPRVTQSSQRELEIARQAVEGGMYPYALEDESWDISMVTEYGDDIFRYMREMELRLMPNPHYMDNQNELDWSMRSVLVDWLIQVHLRFALLPETLFLTVNIIDRFLSCKLVSAARLQLVGATAIFLASKYEEVVCPSLSEVVFMVDKAYSGEEILRAERYMLNMLSFDLGWPGPMSFLRRISKADEYDYDTRFLAKYFLEVAMMDERFIGSPPSFVAAGAHCLSRLMLKKGSWSEAHAYYSNYTYSQLYSLLHLLVECCKSPTSHHSSVYEKYSHRRLQQISFLVETEIRKGFEPPLPTSVDDMSSEMETWSIDGFVDEDEDIIQPSKENEKESTATRASLLPVAVKP